MATPFLSLYFIETISPVDTHQSDHRQEDTNAHSGRTFQRERIEVFERCPRITALDKSQTIYRRRRLQQEREVQLHREPGISPTVGIGRKSTVIIAPQPDCFRSICIRPGHTVATHMECFERRLLILVILPQQSEIGTSHKHKCIFFGVIQRGIYTALEFYFIIFYPAI